MKSGGLELDELDLGVQPRRFGPKPAQPAARHAAEAGKAEGHSLKTAIVPTLFDAHVVLPALGADGAGTIPRNEVEREDEAPQELARGCAQAPTAEAAPRERR